MRHIPGAITHRVCEGPRPAASSTRARRRRKSPPRRQWRAWLCRRIWWPEVCPQPTPTSHEENGNKGFSYAAFMETWKHGHMETWPLSFVFARQKPTRWNVDARINPVRARRTMVAILSGMCRPTKAALVGNKGWPRPSLA